MVHWPPRAVTGALAAGVAIGLVPVAVLAGGAIRGSPAVSCSIPVPASRAGPLGPAGKMTTVAGAQSIAGYPVPTPDAPAASRADLTQVWADGQQVALVFAGGKVTITMAPATYADAAAWFRKLLREISARATIGHVHGAAALVITPDTDACAPNPAWVEFDRGGIDINVARSSGNHGHPVAERRGVDMVQVVKPGLPSPTVARQLRLRRRRAQLRQAGAGQPVQGDVALAAGYLGLAQLV